MFMVQLHYEKTSQINEVRLFSEFCKHVKYICFIIRLHHPINFIL